MKGPNNSASHESIPHMISDWEQPLRMFCLTRVSRDCKAGQTSVPFLKVSKQTPKNTKRLFIDAKGRKRGRGGGRVGGKQREKEDRKIKKQIKPELELELKTGMLARLSWNYFSSN